MVQNMAIMFRRRKKKNQIYITESAEAVIIVMSLISVWETITRNKTKITIAYYALILWKANNKFINEILRCFFFYFCALKKMNGTAW